MKREMTQGESLDGLKTHPNFKYENLGRRLTIRNYFLGRAPQNQLTCYVQADE